MLRELQGQVYEDRLKSLGLPTLEYRRERADLIQVFKIVKGIDKVAENVLPEFQRATTRGNMYKVSKPRARLDMRKGMFKHRIVNNWNSLPNEVVDAPSVNAFKSLLGLTKSGKKVTTFSLTVIKRTN